MAAGQKPIPLMSIQRGGHTVDGQSVLFEFESQSGKTFPFTCRHEAVGGIVDMLLGLAENAKIVRGDPDIDVIPAGTEQRQSVRAVIHLEPSLSNDGQWIVISLQRGPILKHTMILEPHRCKLFGEQLLEMHRQWLENFPPH
jgi:hypothetical protein